MAMTTVNLEEACQGLTELWSPRVVARVADQYVKVAKLQGEFVWHTHEAEDELFLVLKGRMQIRLEDGEVDLAPGDLYVVPAGVRHQPFAPEECWIALIEPISTKHTGDTITDRTRSIEEQLG